MPHIHEKDDADEILAKLEAALADADTTDLRISIKKAIEERKQELRSE